MKAIEFLRQVDKLDRLIANKLIEKERWKALAMGTSVSAEGERPPRNKKCAGVCVQKHFIDKELAD